MAKKKKAKRQPQNPTDPNLLARAVLEAAIGGPLMSKATRKKAKSKKNS